jgi:hypothetical protein
VTDDAKEIGMQRILLIGLISAADVKLCAAQRVILANEKALQ